MSDNDVFDSSKAGFWANRKAMFAILLISMCSFQYGLDFGLIGGIQAMVGFLRVFGYEDPNLPLGWNLTTKRQQLISSLMTLGAVVASGCAGPIAWKLGRKMCIWIACVMCCVANIIMMATTSIGALYFGRLLLGLANGLFMAFSQLYIQEVAPARYRGISLAGFQFWTSIGALVGTVVDNFTAKIDGRNSYIIPLSLIYIVPVIIFIGLFFIPESPRWLMQQGKQEEARKAFARLLPSQEMADAEVKAVQAAIDQEKTQKSGVGVMDMFNNPVDRRRTLLAVAAVNTQAASGAFFIISYGTYFFEMAGVGAPFENACILNAAGVVAIIINTCVITKYGRRRVFLVTGLLICGFVQLIVAVVYTIQPTKPSSGKVIVAMTVIYIVGYNGLIATYAWLSGGEIPSQRLRSYTLGVAAAVGFFGAWLASFTAPYFINPAALNWGPKYGYIWFPSCLIAAAFIFVYMPEIQNRTLEEITEMFEARLPARKFKGYKCVGSAIAVGDKVEETGTPLDAWNEKKGAAEHVENVVEERR